MASARSFDVIVIVDWSANSTPKVGADSIWVAEHDADAGSGHERRG